MPPGLPLPQACLPFLAAGHPPALTEAARRALLALAALDPDAVWLLLSDAAQVGPCSVH